MPAVVDLVERLAAVHDCDVVALRYPPARPRYRVAGARVRALGLGSVGGPAGRAAVLARGVRAVLAIDRRRPIDVVHGLWADEAGAVATIAGRLLRRPVVVSLMGGELAALADIGYGAGLGRGGRWTTAISLRGADLVTAGSEAARPVRAGTAARGVARCSHRWASISRCSGPTCRRRAAAPDSDPAGGASCSPAASNRSRTRPSRCVSSRRWPSIGPGCGSRSSATGGLRGDLERLAAELGVGDRVRFLGQVPRNEMPARYRAASAAARDVAARRAIDGRRRGGGVGDPRRRDAGRRPPGPGERRADRPARRRGGARRRGRAGARRPAPRHRDGRRRPCRRRSPGTTSTGPAPT